MKKILTLSIIVFFLFCVISILHPENLISRRNVSVCVYENTPKIIITPDKKIAGFHPAVMNAIAELEGWSIEYVIDSWDGCLSRLEANNVDIVPDIAFSPEREKKYYFNNESVLINWACVYIQRGKRIESIFDFGNKKIAVMRNSIHTDGPGGIKNLLKNFGISCEYIPVENYEEVLKLLHEKKCDIGIVNRLYGYQIEKRYDIVKTSIVFNPIQLKYGISRKNPEKEYFVEKLDEGLNKLKSDPGSVYYKSLENLLQQNTVNKEFSIPSWVRYLLLSGFFLLIFVIMFAILLKMQVSRKTGIIMELNKNLEEKIAERTLELNVAKEAAESANRSKSAFLASMSHELRTPLNSIIGFNGILLNEIPGPLNFEQKKQLKMIKGSSHHLLDLINDILDISKIEANEFELSNELFNVRDMINNVIISVTPLIEKKNIVLKHYVDEKVGNVKGDERRIKQVLINLINNAIKFTNEGEIIVTCEIIDSFLEVTVKDTGIGIKQENLEKLFVPFQQLDVGTSRKYEGTGLGLSICKKIIEIMKGNISVESMYGKGSTFRFSFPLFLEGKK